MRWLNVEVKDKLEVLIEKIQLAMIVNQSKKTF
jgi:hypothetical protein